MDPCLQQAPLAPQKLHAPSLYVHASQQSFDWCSTACTARTAAVLLVTMYRTAGRSECFIFYDRQLFALALLWGAMVDRASRIECEH